jgi:hypothetical protein
MYASIIPVISSLISDSEIDPKRILYRRFIRIEGGLGV